MKTKAVKLSEVTRELRTRRPDLFESEEVVLPISSMKDLSALIHNGDLVMFAGRTAMGKTMILYDLLIRQVIEQHEPVLLISFKGDIDFIARKIEVILEEQNAVDLNDLIHLNSEQNLNENSLKDLITWNIDRERVRGIYIDDFQEIAYPTTISSTYDWVPYEEKDFGFSLLRFFKEKAKVNWVPIILTDMVDNTISNLIPNIENLKNPNIGFIADYVFSIARLEYFDMLEDSEGNSTIDRVQIRMIKTKYGKAGEVVSIQFPEQNIAPF